MTAAAYTPGPWRWEINVKSKRVQLSGGPPRSGFGRFDLTVMSFARWGMNGASPVFWHWDGNVGDPKMADELAKPVAGREHHAAWFQDLDHPDARLIAQAPDMHALIADLARDDVFRADSAYARRIAAILAAVAGEPVS